jgi:uncharacterized protein YciI
MLCVMSTLSSVSESVSVPVTPTQREFLLRLIPPRPTFHKNLSVAEQELMDQHFLYWKDLFEKGICVFGGPVRDPRGAYGVLAIRAASKDEARNLADADPSVKAGINRMEVAEMRITFPPKTPQTRNPL